MGRRRATLRLALLALGIQAVVAASLWLFYVAVDGPERGFYFALFLFMLALFTCGFAVSLCLSVIESVRRTITIREVLANALSESDALVDAVSEDRYLQSFVLCDARRRLTLDRRAPVSPVTASVQMIRVERRDLSGRVVSTLTVYCQPDRTLSYPVACERRPLDGALTNAPSSVEHRQVVVRAWGRTERLTGVGIAPFELYEAISGETYVVRSWNGHPVVTAHSDLADALVQVAYEFGASPDS
jgi:hypothetical protein